MAADIRLRIDRAEEAIAAGSDCGELYQMIIRDALDLAVPPQLPDPAA